MPSGYESSRARAASTSEMWKVTGKESIKPYMWVRAFSPDVWAEAQTHMKYLLAKD